MRGQGQGQGQWREKERRGRGRRRLRRRNSLSVAEADAVPSVVPVVVFCFVSVPLPSASVPRSLWRLDSLPGGRDTRSPPRTRSFAPTEEEEEEQAMMMLMLMRPEWSSGGGGALVLRVRTWAGDRLTSADGVVGGRSQLWTLLTWNSDQAEESRDGGTVTGAEPSAQPLFRSVAESLFRRCSTVERQTIAKHIHFLWNLSTSRTKIKIRFI